MTRTRNRTLRQELKWWWKTRIRGLFTVRLKSVSAKNIQDAGAEIAFKRRNPVQRPPSEGITVILNCYRRTKYLPNQVAALKAQSVQPVEIWAWTNDGGDPIRDFSSIVDRIVVSNTNWLFWGRFALANLARTKYVALFDDDILPEKDWFKNCLDTIESGFDGILGGSGVLLPPDRGYSSKKKVGWNGKQSHHTEQVDLVGHAWFMRKELLQYMWREEPINWENGEDIHLSYMALKHGGIKTFVPPHPPDSPELWSCRPDFGKIVGRQKEASFKLSDHRDTRTLIVDAYRRDGWIPVLCSLPAEKTFAGDLDFFNSKLYSRHNFSLVRFGDGEMLIINGRHIDLSGKFNGEHRYEPGNPDDETHRRVLSESLRFKDPNYFVGLPCRCCVGDERCDALRKQSGQYETQLTWANIFVNANYRKFLAETVPMFRERAVNIICHEKADLSGLPFDVKRSFRVGPNAWVRDFSRVLDEISKHIEKTGTENEAFIFCAGVLSNMLIYELTKRFPNNTYIDAGSVFDDYMRLGKTRKYLKGSRRRLKKACIW